MNDVISAEQKTLYISHEYTDKNGWGTCTYNWLNGLETDDSTGSVLLTWRKAQNFKSSNVRILKVLNSFADTKFKKLLVFLDEVFIRLRINIKKFDTVHVMVEPYIPLAHRLAKIMGAKLIINVHGTYCVRPRQTGHFDKYLLAYQYASLIISNSDYTSARLKDVFGVNSVSVPLGVNNNIFFPLLKETQKKEYFMFVGSSKPRKGLKFAIEGFYQFLQKYPSYEFIVIGEFDEKSTYNKSILEFIDTHNLLVKFLNQVSQETLVRHYQETTAHVLPSISEPFYFEGFGLVHLEANCCGSLSIGSKDSANEEVIINGVSGYLVQQGNANSIAEAMVKSVELLKDNNSAVRNNCTQHASNYSWADAIRLMKQ